MKSSFYDSSLLQTDSFPVLLFSVGGTKMAALAEQIEMVTGVDDPATGSGEIPEISGIYEHSWGTEKGSQKVLYIRNEAGRMSFISDSVEDLMIFPLDSIRALPHLIERHAAETPFRGVLLREDELILLVDCCKLALQKDVRMQPNDAEKKEKEKGGN